MTTEEAVKSFQDGVRNLTHVLDVNEKARVMLGELLATLILPANRQHLIDNNRHAISMMFKYIDGVAEQYTKLGTT